MVIDIEYTLDIFAGPPFLNSNLSVSRSSGGDQRMALNAVVSDPAAGFARQARPSSEMRIFSCTRMSVVFETDLRSYPFEVTMSEIHAMKVLKAARGIL